MFVVHRAFWLVHDQKMLVNPSNLHPATTWRVPSSSSSSALTAILMLRYQMKTVFCFFVYVKSERDFSFNHITPWMRLFKHFIHNWRPSLADLGKYLAWNTQTYRNLTLCSNDLWLICFCMEWLWITSLSQMFLRAVIWKKHSDKTYAFVSAEGVSALVVLWKSWISLLNQENRKWPFP